MHRVNRFRWVFLSLVFLLACQGNAEDTARKETKKIRQPARAGQFYPGNAKELKETVDRFLEEAKKPDIEGRIVAVMSPHAGYPYCGDTMAASYKALEGGDYDLAVILGSPHMGVSGVALSGMDEFATPLGNVPVDTEIVKEFAAAGDPFRIDENAHRKEHSIETQLPFLIESVGTIPIVPMTVRISSPDTIERAGREIARAVKGKKALLVCAVDMTHYPPYEEAKRIDREALDAIATLDPLQAAGTMDRLELEAMTIPSLSCVSCGKEAILVTMHAAKYLGADTAEILRCRTSGDVAGTDKSRVVGYGSVVFIDTGGNPPDIPPAGERAIDSRARVRPPDHPLNDEEKRILLRIARKSLEAAVKGEDYKPPAVDDPALNEHRGSFVTLTEAGELRGCLGVYTPDEPLYKVVADRARASALEDPRFPPVRPEELPDVEIEISALTPLKKVENIDEIEVGRDGLYIQRGNRAGTLLPQVASERGWDRETFLSHTCYKARLPLDAWKNGATVYRYAADVFGEKEGPSPE
jgi:AmmeMemoRadiSam system protein B/AmmeMemoRadiSam system protein A